MPYISAPYRRLSFWNRVRAALISMPIQDTKGRHIDIAPWPSHVDDEGVMHFKDTDSPESVRVKTMVVKPDVVIQATGYTRRFPFLDDSYGTPSSADVRGIYHENDISTAFIGFVRPSFGAIPPLAELQAQLWVLRLVQSSRSHNLKTAVAASTGENVVTRDVNALTAYELDYEIHPRAGRDLFTEKLAVDHECYAYQLALDMGTAPTFSYIRRQGFRVLWTWAMGSNFNTKFRLVGPWRDEERALEIMRGELFGVCKRLGPFPFFFIYTLVPFVIFGTASLWLYIRAWIVRILHKKEDLNDQ
jgi:dimethylaniline monooxygenase (N-oxide forming)